MGHVFIGRLLLPLIRKALALPSLHLHEDVHDLVEAWRILASAAWGSGNRLSPSFRWDREDSSGKLSFYTPLSVFSVSPSVRLQALGLPDAVTYAGPMHPTLESAKLEI